MKLKEQFLPSDCDLRLWHMRLAHVCVKNILVCLRRNTSSNQCIDKNLRALAWHITAVVGHNILYRNRRNFQLQQATCEDAKLLIESISNAACFDRKDAPLQRKWINKEGGLVATWFVAIPA